jgi:hypothetical protein
MEEARDVQPDMLDGSAMKPWQFNDFSRKRLPRLP